MHSIPCLLPNVYELNMIRKGWLKPCTLKVRKARQRSCAWIERRFQKRFRGQRRVYPSYAGSRRLR